MCWSKVKFQKKNKKTFHLISNHGVFLVFLASLLLNIISVIIATGVKSSQLLESELSSQKVCSYIAFIFLMGVSGIFFFPVLLLTGVHIKNFMLNKTTAERYGNRTQIRMQEENSVSYFIFFFLDV